jgi:hypothetical protein
MGKTWGGILVVLVLAALATSTGGSSRDGGRRAVMSGERDGLRLEVGLVQAHGVIGVEARVENRRQRPVFLVPDHCGGVTSAFLVRTRLQPQGRAWNGSLQALKRFILDRQEAIQEPDRLSPSLPSNTPRAVTTCVRPRRPTELAPGGSLRERWEADPHFGSALDAVGSENTKVRVEVVEARDPAEIELLDLMRVSEADARTAGRRLRLEKPASAVIDYPPIESPSALSLGQLYDRLLAHDGLRRWLATQPAKGWRSAELTTVGSGLRFSAVTTGYERAVIARARADGSGVRVRLPTDRDRIRRFQDRPATLPRGIRVQDRASSWDPTRDVIAGRLALPSGRVVADGFPSGASRPLDYRLTPGAYPVYVTLARHERGNSERVALATLVVSRNQPVRWRRSGGIGVDGGVAAFTSLEGARALDRLMSDAPNGYWEEAWHSLAAHDDHVTEVAIDGDLNQVMFGTGHGDGGYPLLVGVDGEGRPVRFVLDFYVLHLDWPGRPDP